MRSPLSILTSALSVLALAPAAAAQEGVRFEYSAPAGCPSQAEFLSRVRERLLGASEALPVERRGLVVRVNVEPARGNARVEFQEADGGRVERAVQGSDCDELVSGVALITALAFGSRSQPSEDSKGAAANADAKPVEAAPEAGAAKPADPAKPEEPKDPAKLTPMAGPPKTRTVTRRPSSTPRSSRLAPNAARTRSNVIGASPDDAEAEERPQPDSLVGYPVRRGPGWEAGAGGWISSWLAPGRTLGADAFLRVGERTAGWSARLSLAYGAGATAQVDEREADFSFLGGRLEGCPVGLLFSGTARLEPCLAAELGQLRGTGREDSALQVGQDQSVFWAAAVLLGRVRATIARRVVVEAQGELGIPVTSHDFMFQDPEAEVFSVPSVGGAGRIGIAVPFL